MKTFSLNGAWSMRAANQTEWLQATVPGCNYTDLIENGLIPDPFLQENEKDVQWVAERDWEYTRQFEVAADLYQEDRIELICEGLDTLAEISINGKLVGKSENMFHAQRWEVKETLKPGANQIHIRFRSPEAFIKQRQAQRKLPSTVNAGAAHLRKVQSHFGWDWGPRLAQSGIWREIKLEGFSTARIEDVHLRQEHLDGQVFVSANTRLKRWSDEPLFLSLTITAPDGTMFETCLKAVPENASHFISLEVQNPHLWWPNGLGEQPLYQVQVRLFNADSILDEKTFQLGLRTLELRRETDQWGESFLFVVNGVPLFAKGANWIPADSFPTRMSPERYESLIRDSALANMNMLRIWGGGYYEDEKFYDLCDQYGILIWQDFTFACDPAPLDEVPFLTSFKTEMEGAVRRLRHRTCLALWCGNNELEMLWKMVTRGDKSLTSAYQQTFHQDLPAWLAELDPDTAYWPSSPSSNTFLKNTNSDGWGDTHLWQVWHGLKPFTFYRKRFTRFCSEFGMEALPAMETIREFAGTDEVTMESPVMLHHQRSIGGNEKILYYLWGQYHPPQKFSDLVYLTQIQQAETIRFGVEHWRRYFPRCAGALYWQLNDCWPVTSWASVDYHGRWKALQYAAKRFYVPLALSLEEAGSRVTVFLSNESRQPWQGELRWSLETLSGEKIREGQEKIVAEALTVNRITALDFENELRQFDKHNVVFVAGIYQEEMCLGWRTVVFAPDKELALPDPKLKWQVRQEGKRVMIALSAQALARFVWLRVEGADPVFCDNYFDLPAGWSTEISCDLPQDWDLSQFEENLRVRSLNEVETRPLNFKDRWERLKYSLKPSTMLMRIIFALFD